VPISAERNLKSVSGITTLRICMRHGKAGLLVRSLPRQLPNVIRYCGLPVQLASVALQTLPGIHAGGRLAKNNAEITP
jgi:hypothetical protein